MRNFILALTSTLLVMLVTPPTHKTANEQPIRVKKQSVIQPLQPTVHAQKQEVAKLPTPAPTPVIQPVSGSCEDWMTQAGIPITTATKTLIINESGCRHTAINPSSGACGIPQALPCSKMPCTLQDPVCQLKWMDNYIKQRYSTWNNALAYWNCIGYCTNNYGTVHKTATWY